MVVFTARPGRLKADIKVGVGTDRTPEFRNTPEYNKLRIEIWELLREEVLRARAESEAPAS